MLWFRTVVNVLWILLFSCQVVTKWILCPSFVLTLIQVYWTGVRSLNDGKIIAMLGHRCVNNRKDRNVDKPATWIIPACDAFFGITLRRKYMALALKWCSRCSAGAKIWADFYCFPDYFPWRYSCYTKTCNRLLPSRMCEDITRWGITPKKSIPSSVRIQWQDDIYRLAYFSLVWGLLWCTPVFAAVPKVTPILQFRDKGPLEYCLAFTLRWRLPALRDDITTSLHCDRLWDDMVQSPLLQLLALSIAEVK